MRLYSRYTKPTKVEYPNGQTHEERQKFYDDAVSKIVKKVETKEEREARWDAEADEFERMGGEYYSGVSFGTHSVSSQLASIASNSNT